ncbi:hypothetical protein IGB42_04042 [Andreprevotia sp. IGB-42]|uniref:FkbM family methyltransferase n=1 Tax=Andreprevotia sp. IGB-42 TaxID=2497473 RepID=UPI0013577BEC|nr:FkbM family methyltransferase [Andreprevotia sp. IGB-42]KAF0811510.1 hypothetical protein IGB42_04042 [Andreprevotia sp. IGB-42]
MVKYLIQSRLYGLFSLGKKALANYGWLQSYTSRSSVDRHGDPVPWITYPAIDFLDRRLHQHLDVFEFGCGNSTLWLSKKTRAVHSVEHDADWFQKIKATLPGNAFLQYVPLEYDGDYCRSVLNGKWHVIFVDGRDRVNCIKHALHALTTDGIVILDNSDRKNYGDALEVLADSGFRQLPFTGLAPITPHISETSIFYRDQNCLGL